MNNKTKADIIRDSVTMSDVLSAYGISLGKRGRIPCPIHQGHNQSSFSYNKTQFQCFNCGAKGGVIEFVKDYLECDFEKALSEFNRLFRLWDDENDVVESFADRRRRKSRRRERDGQRVREERKKEKKEALLLELHRLIANKIKYAPKSESDEWHPLYIEALRKLPAAEWRVDCS